MGRPFSLECVHIHPVKPPEVHLRFCPLQGCPHHLPGLSPQSLSILLLPKAARASLSANLTISGHCSEAIPDSHHFPSKFPALTGAWRSFETCPGSRLPRGAPFPRARPLCHGCVRSLTVPQFTRTFHTPVSWPSCCLEHHASPFCLAPSPLFSKAQLKGPSPRSLLWLPSSLWTSSS